MNPTLIPMSSDDREAVMDIFNYSVLAGISSLNEGSIKFHLQNGFAECGRFRGVGRKKGHIFDMVYCQKML